MQTKIEKISFNKSSLIESAEYDHLMSNLSLIFKKDKGVYVFCEVPYELFIELKQADSVGQYFHKNIKGKYDFLKKVNKNG